MTQTRRAHRKSRTGCAECKRRRIKCDENRPRCSHCVRYEKACIFPHSSATIPSPSPSRSSQPQANPSPQSVEPGLPSTVFNTLELNSETSSNSHFHLKDMALLHHWSLTTSVSIVATPELNYYWQTLLPQVAFRHEYVMHSILSLTALHVAYLHPLKRHDSVHDAAQYHFKALDGFREDIKHIGPENCNALFINAILTFFYAFLTFGVLYDNDSDTSGAARTSRILGADWIPLVRGVEAVLGPVYDHISAGPFKEMLSLGNWGELDPDSAGNSDPYHEQLLKIRDIWENGENAAVYTESLNFLRRCRMWIAQFQAQPTNDRSDWGLNRDSAAPFMWLFFAPNKYFELLEQRQPPALVIFAWFGASIHCLNRYWWMEGCGKSIVNVVEEILGPYWAPCIEWPRRVVTSG